MASQSNVTYAVFTYECGYIRWTTNSAVVGFNSDTEYINHPLSRTSNITDIDCDDTVSGWTNIVYRIDQGITITFIVYYSESLPPPIKI